MNPVSLNNSMELLSDTKTEKAWICDAKNNLVAIIFSKKDPHANCEVGVRVKDATDCIALLGRSRKQCALNRIVRGDCLHEGARPQELLDFPPAHRDEYTNGNDCRDDCGDQYDDLP